MNNLTVTELKTPIEIALQIDENGMTTARKLYEFLELAKGQFARWTKTNIEEDAFYEEGCDWIGFDIMLNGNETKDYKLTTEFAKHLCMLSRSEKGKIARKYFIKVEDKLKVVANTYKGLSPQLQMFQSIFNAVANNESLTKQALETSQQALSKVESIKDIVALNPNDWRKETSNLINKMALNMGGYENIRPIREESYKLLEQRYGVALGIRLTNKKKTMALNGTCKSKLDKLNQLDVITEDKKLIEGYTQIIKEMAIKYRVA